MVETWVNPETGEKYQEETTSSETLDDGTKVTHSTWIIVEDPTS